MAKILILIGAHLCTAPRPYKEALTLAKLGHDVKVRGVWFDKVLIDRDKEMLTSAPFEFQAIVNFQPENKVTNLCTRGELWFARKLFAQAGYVSPALFGYAARQMLSEAQRVKADLTIVHSEASLWVGKELHQRGFQVGVDFEDWFSEDLLPEARKGRPVEALQELEAYLHKHSTYKLTTSDVMATAMQERFGGEKCTTIYNVFPWSERESLDGKKKDREGEHETLSLHWFSHSIGRGRGLETVFAALPVLPTEVHLHLRGNCTDATHNWIRQSVPPDSLERVHIHPLVPPAELLSRIAEHDVGLALESTEVLSRDLTVTNKLFQYMQAGLAVVATETRGQKEVLKEYGEETIPCHSVPDFVSAVKSLAQDPAGLKAVKQRSLELVQEKYCWEKGQEKMVQQLNKALGE